VSNNVIRGFAPFFIIMDKEKLFWSFCITLIIIALYLILSADAYFCTGYTREFPNGTIIKEKECFKSISKMRDWKNQKKLEIYQETNKLSPFSLDLPSNFSSS